MNLARMAHGAGAISVEQDKELAICIYYNGRNNAKVCQTGENVVYLIS